jgi:uncharacterized protein RhaS with RHS repeats
LVILVIPAYASYQYPPESHRLGSITGSGSQHFLYDENGNTVDNSRFGFIYGQNNRLRTVTSGGATVAEYRYNGRGERVKKITGSTVRFYHYDQTGLLLAETNSTGATLREYVYLEGLPVALINSTGIYYYHTDHLGTPQFLTDSTQAVAWQANYDPFGRATVVTQGVVE